MATTEHASARAEIVVDLAAIRHNVRALRATAGVPLMAVVKADGYGHGMVPVARAAREAGAEWIATATLDEAVALRDAGDTGPLLCWLAVPGDDYAPALARGVEVSAYSVAQLDEIAAAVGRLRAAAPATTADTTTADTTTAGTSPPPAHVQLKVDTGLVRGGAEEAAWPGLWARALAGEADGTWQITGLWSHFACADEPAHPANDAQQHTFDRAIAAARAAGLRPTWCHLSNSAATLVRPQARYDAVRCGIAVYGLDPAPGASPDVGLVPAMTARARLVLVKPVEPGQGVSYGHTWVADRPTTIGLVPAGYAEGVPRHAGNTASVAVAGRRRPIRGRICMDQFVVDLDGDDVAAGEPVVLFGRPVDDQPTAQDWAEACDTISYEIVTRLGGRMTRRYVDSEREQEVVR